jgi:hypothetical protein
MTGVDRTDSSRKTNEIKSRTVRGVAGLSIVYSAVPVGLV